jgi:hypothetical protein
MSELVVTVTALASAALLYWHGYMMGQLHAGRNHLADLRASSERMDAMNIELARAFGRVNNEHGGDGDA